MTEHKNTFDIILLIARPAAGKSESLTISKRRIYLRGLHVFTSTNSM